MSLKPPAKKVSKKVRQRTPQEAWTVARKYMAAGEDEQAIRWFKIAGELSKKAAA